MSDRTGGCVLRALSCIILLGSTMAVGAETAPKNLARYYGFKTMEILKFKWGVSDPVIADINHDGLNDMIVVNNRKARIDLLLQKKGFQPDKVVPIPEEDDVNDLFGKEASWRFKRVSFDLDVGVSSFVVADVNSDGLLDLAYYSREGLYVALQRDGGKDAAARKPKTAPGEQNGQIPPEPKWAAPIKIDITTGQAIPRALVAGDLNGDKRTDLALLASDGTFVITQKKDGTLALPVKHHCGADKIYRLYVADINADGLDDLTVTVGDSDNPVRVRFQTPDGKLGPEVRYHMPPPLVLELAKLDPKGKTCFVTISAHSGRVQIRELSRSKASAKYPIFTYPLPAGADAVGRDVVAADVNGDGLLDVVASEPGRAEFLLFLAEAATSLGQTKQFPGLKDMKVLRAGDLDGHRKQAIVALSPSEKQIGISRLKKGRLTYPEAVAVKGDPVAMDLADIDGDGRLDLLYIGRDKAQDKYYLRTILALGRKDAAADVELNLTELKDKPIDMRAADIDHDGMMDVIILRPYGPVLLVRQVRAKKMPTTRPASAPATRPTKVRFEQVKRQNIHAGLVSNIFAGSFTIAPLGPKGTAALLLAQKRFARALSFSEDKGWYVLDQYQAPNRQSNLVVAAAGRFGPKQPISIVTYDAARSRLYILTRKPDGTYRTEKELEIGGLTAKKILFGNFGGKTPVSLLLCGANKLIRIPTIEDTDTLLKIASFDLDIKDGRYGALAVGDINSDGLVDVVLCEQAKSHVEILTFDPAGKLVSAMKFKVFDEPRPVERSPFSRKSDRRGEPRRPILGDVTGDGKTDLILMVHDRIIIYPQD